MTQLAYVVKYTLANGEPDIIVFHNRASAKAAQKTIPGSVIHPHMTGEAAPRVKLSGPQKAFLASFDREGYRLAPGGFHNSARAASAFYRTARALSDMGLVKVSGSTARLTWLGLAWAVAVLRGEA